MKTLASVLGKPLRFKNAAGPVYWPLPEQLIGIEIEVESKALKYGTHNLFPYWNKIGDGSLLSGAEFVLQQPLAGSSLSTAIHQFFSQIKTQRATTSSTHIHVDMMEDNTNVNTVQAMLLLVYILEKALYNVADPGREWCGYTNSLSSAPEDMLAELLRPDLIDNVDSLITVCNNGYGAGRYYGFNVLALQKYGSVEFRYFPTATSPEELVDWVMLVQSFKRAALAISDPKELETIVATERDYVDFLGNFFGKWVETILKHVPWRDARRNYYKAMAVPMSIVEGNKHKIVINSEALLKNKGFAKLIRAAKRKRKEEMSQVRVAVYVSDGASGGAVPNATENNGMLLGWEGQWYICNARNWIPMYDVSLTEVETILGCEFAAALPTMQTAVADSSISIAAKARMHTTLDRIVQNFAVQPISPNVDQVETDYDQEEYESSEEGEDVPEDLAACLPPADPYVPSVNTYAVGARQVIRAWVDETVPVAPLTADEIAQAINYLNRPL